MNQDQIIRAWKEPSFRASLSTTQRAALPASPAGAIELSMDEMMDTVGGTDPVSVSIAISISLLIPAVTTAISIAAS